MVEAEKQLSQHASITPAQAAPHAFGSGSLPFISPAGAEAEPQRPNLERAHSAPPTSHKLPPINHRKHHFVPSTPLQKSPSWKKSFWSILTYSYLNILLVFVPVSWAVEFTHCSPTIIFVMSALAVIPLAALLSFATEELALRLGDTLGALLNCSFGNAVELIIAILALVKGEIRIVQAAMIGSILSNCLLVLGCCFFAGGLKFHEQGYRVPVQQLHISLLGMAVMAIVLPAGFYSAFSQLGGADQSQAAQDAQDAEAGRLILEFSHGVAILLLLTYFAFLVFMFGTHSYMYQRNPVSTIATIEPPDGAVFKLPWRSQTFLSSITSRSDDGASTIGEPRDVENQHREKPDHSDMHDGHEPRLTVPIAACLMLGVTVITGFTCEWLVSSINGIAQDQNVSKEWLALILLPLLGNAVEHVTAVVVSCKGKMELALGVAVGSSIQVALLLLPFMVLLGWIIGQPLTLYFDTYETITLFISVLIVNFAISDGRSHWMEGFLLMMTYILIALAFWYYPGSSNTIN